MQRLIWGSCMLIITLTLGGARPLLSADSKRDYVPDEATAIRIAEAVLIPVHGQQQVEAQRPYVVSTPEQDYWLVSGSSQKKQFGGTFAVWIKKKSGCITNISYTK
jgi:hypothetical protein